MNNGEVGTRFSIKQVESYFCVGMSTILCGIGISQKGKSKGECKNQRVELNFLSSQFGAVSVNAKINVKVKEQMAITNYRTVK